MTSYGYPLPDKNNLFIYTSLITVFVTSHHSHLAIKGRAVFKYTRYQLWVYFYHDKPKIEILKV